MTSRAILGVMKLKGTVKNGLVAVDLPDGTPVTVLVEELPLPTYQLDDRGRLIITPGLILARLAAVSGCRLPAPCF
jgi:hypothetical protein